MRLLLACIALTLCWIPLNGQSPHPCGAPPFKSPWLKRYQAQPQAFERGGDTTLYVPLTIHLVGYDNEVGYMRYAQLMESLSQLQIDFEQANIRFFLEGDIRRPANSAWADHETVQEGYQMMLANDVPNTINCYFVNNPAGNLGYNLPYASVAVRNTATGLGNYTLAHEIGHNLSIQHPFLGWEGGVSWDGSVDHNYAEPAPTQVLYNYTSFQQEPYFDTLIIDTAFVELVDGSNCAIAADGFCDTPPDYLYQGQWNCNPDGTSITQQTDPNGVVFFSQAQFIMNYATDACQGVFSNEQMGAMRANLLDEKADYLYDQEPPEPLDGLPILALRPQADAVLSPADARFEWQAVEHADGYLLEVSLFPSFAGGVTKEYLVWGDTSYLASDLMPERTYYWRVKPFSRYEFDADWSATISFQTSELTSTLTLGESARLRLSPQPVAAGALLRIENPSVIGSKPVWIIWRDGTGRRLTSRQTAASDLSQLEVPAFLAPGMYLIQLRTDQGQWVEKVLVR